MGVRVDILDYSLRMAKSGWLKAMVVLISVGLVGCGQHGNQTSQLPSPQANPYLEAPDSRAPVFSAEQEKQFARAAGLPEPVAQEPASTAASPGVRLDGPSAEKSSVLEAQPEASETEVTVLSAKMNAANIPQESVSPGQEPASKNSAQDSGPDAKVNIVYGPKPANPLDVLHETVKRQPYDRQAEQQRNLERLAQQRAARSAKSEPAQAAVKGNNAAVASAVSKAETEAAKPKSGDAGSPSKTPAEKTEIAVKLDADTAATKRAGPKAQDLVPSKPAVRSAESGTLVGSSVKSKYLNMVGVPNSIKQNLLCEKISTAVRELEISQDEIMQSADLQVPEQLPVEYLRKLGEIIRRNGVNVSETILRRDHFVCLMLPVIVKMDRVVFQKRLKVIELQQKQAQNQELTAVEQQWLASLKTGFGLNASASYKDLLSRVDVVPVSLLLAQAALESDWGRYKWAVGNNLFGRHGLNSEACMFTASGVCLKKFASLEEGIGNQLYYLNTGRYEFAVNFRSARAKLREKGRPLDAGVLADSLVGYASIGKEYARRLQALLNKQTYLEKYSFAEGEGRAGVRLANESVDVNIN